MKARYFLLTWLIAILILGCNNQSPSLVVSGVGAMEAYQEETTYPTSKNPVIDINDSEVLAAISGDADAAETLAIIPGKHSEYWLEIAIQNGSQNIYGPYAAQLIGSSPARCYRAMYFLEKAIKAGDEPIAKAGYKEWLSNLEEQKEKTNFKCGCAIDNDVDSIVRCKEK